MSYVLAFLGFSALIILHEAGHFAAAKTVGMRVERFSLFFGPMLVKFRRGETEYGIGPIPLGGYVKITGMNPNEELPESVRPRAYYNQAVWKRIFVISAGPAVNILIAFLIIWVLLLSHGQAGGPTLNAAAGLPRSTAAPRPRFSSQGTGSCRSTALGARTSGSVPKSAPTIAWAPRRPTARRRSRSRSSSTVMDSC